MENYKELTEDYELQEQLQSETDTEVAAKLIDMLYLKFRNPLKAIFEAAGMGGVYYVEGDQLYSAQNWDAEMEGITFALEGDTLTLYSLETALGTDCVFARVSE